MVLSLPHARSFSFALHKYSSSPTLILISRSRNNVHQRSNVPSSRQHDYNLSHLCATQYTYNERSKSTLSILTPLLDERSYWGRCPVVRYDRFPPTNPRHISSHPSLLQSALFPGRQLERVHRRPELRSYTTPALYTMRQFLDFVKLKFRLIDAPNVPDP